MMSMSELAIRRDIDSPSIITRPSLFFTILHGVGFAGVQLLQGSDDRVLCESSGKVIH